MTKLTVCDICNSRLPIRKRKLLITMRQPYFNIELEHQQEFDLCNSCVDTLINLLKEKAWKKKEGGKV
jgi:hypothetical protein